MHRGPQNTLMCNKREKKTNKSFGRKSWVHCLKGDHFQASKSNSQFSYSLDLFSNYNGVLLADLFGSFSFIVVWTVVLIRVTVKSAKQISTATVKTCKANLFTTHEAPIFLGFGGLGGFGVFTASSGGMRG